jgi:transcriptional regulator with XRE-family HTH domain
MEIELMPRPQTTVYTGSGYSLAEFLNANWHLVGRTNAEVAKEMGFSAPNVVSLWRTGKSRVPIERLPQLAELLRIDLAALFPLWAEQYLPTSARKEGWGEAAYRALKSIIERIADEGEMRILKAIRKGLAGASTGVTTDALAAHEALAADPSLADLVIAERDRRQAIRRAGAARAGAKEQGGSGAVYAR